MKHIYRISICLLSLFLTVGYVSAQDTRFSQPLNNQLSLNPAMMGLTNDARVVLNYRNQWASIDKGYSTYELTGLFPLFLGAKTADSTKKEFGKSRLDFGLNLTDDKSDGFNRLNATLSISYGLKLNAANSLFAALNFGYLHYSFDVLTQSFDEQFQQGVYNSSLPNGETVGLHKGAADVGVGFMYHFAPESGKIQAFAGLSGFHINQPNLSLLGGKGTLPARFNFQAGVKVIGAKLDFTPVLIYNVQGPFKQFIGGLLMAYKLDKEKKGKIVIGAWYKESDAIAVQAGYEHRLFFLTYSYDFGISQLARTTNGLMTHEIALGFKLSDIAAKKGIRSRSFL